MNQVSLDIPDYRVEGDSWIKIDFTIDISNEEVKTLTLFVSNMSRVRSCALLQRGMGGFSGIRLGEDGLQLTSGEFTEAELHELLHVLRLVTLEQERSSFFRVAALLQRRIKDSSVAAFLKMARRIYRHGEMSILFPIYLNGKPLFEESVLDIWLNGMQYHSDEEKATAWACLEISLGTQNASSLVRAQLHSKVAALLNVDYVARQVLNMATDA